MKHKRTVFILLLLVLVLAACGGGEEVDPAEFDTIESEVIGVEIGYPDEWEAEVDEFGDLYIASDEALLDEDAEAVLEGALVTITSFDAEMLSFLGDDLDLDDPVSVVNLFVDLATEENDEMEFNVTEEATAVTLDREPGATIILEVTDDDVNGVAYFTAVVDDDRVVYIFGAAEESESNFGNIYEAMLSTLDISNPSPVAAEPDPVATEEESAADDVAVVVEETETEPEPEPEPEPDVELGEEIRSAEGGFSFNTVPDWETEELFGLASASSPDAEENKGPTIFLVGALTDEEMTLDDGFAEFMASFSEDEQQMEVVNTFETEIAGIAARGADLTNIAEDGTPLTGQILFTMASPEQTFVAFGFAPTDRWDAETAAWFNAVMNSVTFFPPEVEAAEVEVRQWAMGAAASSQYSEPGWSAQQAVGEPDLYPDCGDSVDAWASLDSNTVEWLELVYTTPVVPTEINVYETYNPGQIVAVEVRNQDNELHTVYTASPQTLDDCASILTVFPDVDFAVSAVRITVDQSVINNWAEIDAVELVGFADSGTAVSTEDSASPSEPLTIEPQDGFLWHAGGESGFNSDQLGVPDGMDVDANGFLYVADRNHGIWFFNPDGTFGDLLESDTFNNPTDIETSTQGSGLIAVASWGNNNISVFDYGGNLLTSFGSEGNGAGQFALFSPQDLTLDLDQNIYVLDNNEDANGDAWDRIQVFDVAGNYLYEWTVDEEFFAPTALKFWAGPTPDEDRIFVLGFVGGYILEYDLQGNLIRRIGEDAIGFTGPQDLDLDEAGNFYVAVWTPDSVMKLDHDGNLLDQWGISVDDDEGGVPAGAFYQPFGIAVQPDGSEIYVSEWTGDYAYVTAFEFR
ncbi:MAG: hypothetical protein CL608_25725 [Anaerolineaceae bacterium]|nr:hypothetical protein [Anaerolineaceae bacterium]